MPLPIVYYSGAASECTPHSDSNDCRPLVYAVTGSVVGLLSFGIILCLRITTGPAEATTQLIAAAHMKDMAPHTHVQGHSAHSWRSHAPQRLQPLRRDRLSVEQTPEANHLMDPSTGSQLLQRPVANRSDTGGLGSLGATVVWPLVFLITLAIAGPVVLLRRTFVGDRHTDHPGNWTTLALSGDGEGPQEPRESRGHREEEGRGGSVAPTFDGRTAEEKAGRALSNLFTFVSCRIIMSEIEGYDNEGGSAQAHPVWSGLQDALENFKMDETFVDQLMAHENPEMRLTAIRLLEVRKNYAANEFDWDKVREHALTEVSNQGAGSLKGYMDRAESAE